MSKCLLVILLLLSIIGGAFAGVSSHYARSLLKADSVRRAGTLREELDGSKGVDCLYICAQPFIQTVAYLSRKAVSVTQPCWKLKDGIACFHGCDPSRTGPMLSQSFQQLWSVHCGTERPTAPVSRRLVQQAQECYDSLVKELTARFNECIVQEMKVHGNATLTNTAPLFGCVAQGGLEGSGCGDAVVAGAMKSFFATYLHMIEAES